jgi:hypothetical protein
MESEIPISKSQISNNFKAPKSNDPNAKDGMPDDFVPWILDIGFYLGFWIWCFFSFGAWNLGLPVAE